MKNFIALSILALGIISSHSQAQNVVQNARKEQQNLEKQIEQAEQKQITTRGATASYWDAANRVGDLALSLWICSMANALHAAGLQHHVDVRLVMSRMNLARSGLMLAYELYRTGSEYYEIKSLKNEIERLEDFIKNHEKFNTGDTGVTGSTGTQQKTEV